MSRTDSPKPAKIRRDGWTPERQLRFLDALASSRSIGRAAIFVGMSRESAYRLRNRRDGGLFGLLWDRVLEPEPGPGEVHNQQLTDGRIMRLLGTHYRRQRGDFAHLGSKGGDCERPDRTRT